MPPTEIVISDLLGKIRPLIITKRKGDENRDANILIKSDDKKESLAIFFENDPVGNPHMDTLEISGVHGTIDQWRQILLPLLSIKG